MTKESIFSVTKGGGSEGAMKGTSSLIRAFITLRAERGRDKRGFLVAFRERSLPPLLADSWPFFIFLLGEWRGFLTVETDEVCA